MKMYYKKNRVTASGEMYYTNAVDAVKDTLKRMFRNDPMVSVEFPTRKSNRYETPIAIVVGPISDLQIYYVERSGSTYFVITDGDRIHLKAFDYEGAINAVEDWVDGKLNR